ncbi:heavy-metal-associated domain-containing protein [Rhizobium laguerreae]|uniref:heavy-metal-associated domain-containing protein n=1 Tax=Rhizobium laguerreae TaxID=1076926 RepID=UPI001FEBCDB8|nr:heavy-metal-associated domain-containing protein [Rhizobium laguerreae]
MYEFEIHDMTCGHCASTVEKAIKTADPDAFASIDLGTRTAKVETRSDPAAIKTAIENGRLSVQFQTGLISERSASISKFPRRAFKPSARNLIRLR